MSYGYNWIHTIIFSWASFGLDSYCTMHTTYIFYTTEIVYIVHSDYSALSDRTVTFDSPPMHRGYIHTRVHTQYMYLFLWLLVPSVRALSSHCPRAKRIGFIDVQIYVLGVYGDPEACWGSWCFMHNNRKGAKPYILVYVECNICFATCLPDFVIWVGFGTAMRCKTHDICYDFVYCLFF